MEWAPDFLIALFSIVIIDLVLAGDNAIVIALAARELPQEKQKKVIWLGSVGAIVIRSIATLGVVWLLNIPGLLFFGSLILIWITFKLLKVGKEHKMTPATSTRGAIWTIVAADTIMGLDNVLAVAGAAHSNYILVIIGLLISIPIMVLGSTMLLRWTQKSPSVIYIGAGVLALTAAKMIIDEKWFHSFFVDRPLLRYGFCLLVVSVVFFIHFASKKKKQKNISIG